MAGNLGKEEKSLSKFIKSFADDQKPIERLDLNIKRKSLLFDLIFALVKSWTRKKLNKTRGGRFTTERPRTVSSGWSLKSGAQTFCIKANAVHFVVGSRAQGPDGDGASVGRTELCLDALYFLCLFWTWRGIDSFWRVCQNCGHLFTSRPKRKKRRPKQKEQVYAMEANRKIEKCRRLRAGAVATISWLSDCVLVVG